MHKHAALLQQFDDRSVGFEHLQAVVFRQSVVQSSRGIHIASGIKFVLGSGCEVFGSVRRRRVHHSGAGIHRHVIGQNAKDGAVEKGMGKLSILELAAGKPCQRVRAPRVPTFSLNRFASFSATM